MWRTLTVLTAAMGLLIGLAVDAAAGDNAAELAELIDRQIQARLDAEGVARVPPADDAEFLRRVFLDLHGVVPAAERADRFLESKDPKKRTELIEELLASSRLGEHFGDVWRGRLLSPQVNEQRVQAERFTSWLAQRFNDNDGWDKTVGDLLTATGKIEENPAVTYLIEGRHPLGVTDLTDLTSRYFLGVRLNCAQCHDHPFVAWKRQDYWGMAAFFAQIQTPNRPKMVYVAGVRDDPKMTLSSLQGADMIEGIQVRPPTFLDGEELSADSREAHRAALAHWITSRENPYFARATVNRMWWHFFGRGIVNPVDDMHTGNPASHPELLELLSRRFVESGFDLKFLCRAILTSRTYQQTSRPGEKADAQAKLFARMSIKVLSPEQLYDSLVSVLGPPDKASGVDTRLGARYEFCQFFAGDGDPDPTRYERGIPHLLRLMNSRQFTGRNVESLVSRVASPGRSADDIVADLFLTILARQPTPTEQQLARDQLKDTDASPQTVYRELAWALLMSSEFSLNH
ncbi:MAG: DUF1549 and DUF1553 domain-containing protein [Pirellulaceae bacterium]